MSTALSILLGLMLLALPSIHSTEVDVNVHVSSHNQHHPSTHHHQEHPQNNNNNNFNVPENTQHEEAESFSALDSANVDEFELDPSTHIVGTATSPSPISHIALSCKKLGIRAAGDLTEFTIHRESNHYKSNKLRVLTALRQSGLTLDTQKLFIAIGMLDAKNFECAGRGNINKIGLPITGYSIWNINSDLLTYIGSKVNPAELENLNKATVALRLAVNKLGVNGFLDFHRGGKQGFLNRDCTECAIYRNLIASMMTIIDRDPKLLTDERMIDMKVPTTIENE